MRNACRLIALGAAGALSFPAAAANLIENPDFTSGVDGWTTITAGNGTAALDTTTGSPSAPSIRLAANPADSQVSVSSSCMTLPDAGNVDLYMNIMGTSGVAIGTINTYGDDACTDGLSAIDSESFPATDAWATYSMSDVILPQGARSAKIVLTASASPTGSAGDVNFDHILFGPTGTATSAVNINQEGLSGTWYNPATSGQGIQLQISPDDGTPGNGSLFGAWYTYDIAAGPENSQRWYSFDSAITGDEQSATVTIFQNTGGNFDAQPTTSAVAVGTGTLSFDTCETGSFTYSLDDGRSGTIPLLRLLPNAECVETGVPTNPPSDFGLSGTWYNPATSGQGMLIEVNPGDSAAFIGWYTYAADGASAGAAGQRWFSAQAPYTAGAASIDLTIYASTGGTFDSSAGTVHTDAVGTATLTYTSCNDAELAYMFTAGELNGRHGTIPLSRLGATPASCSFDTTH